MDTRAEINSFKDFCPKCLHFEEQTGVCKKIFENVRDYPKKFVKKCNGEYYEYDPNKKIEESEVEEELDDYIPTSPSDPTFQTMLTNMNGYMKFVGMFRIIFGAIYCLTIIGAIVGIPIIISGIRVREAADSFSTYIRSNEFIHLQIGFEKQSRFFFIEQVFLIIGLVISAIYLLFIFANL